MSCTTTSPPVPATRAPVRQQIRRKVSIDNEGNIIRETRPKEREGKHYAFSEESDLIAATNTFFFMAALLLTFVTVHVTFPQLLGDPIPMPYLSTKPQPIFELPPFPSTASHRKDSLLLAKVQDNDMDNDIIRFVMGPSPEFQAQVSSAPYLVDMVDQTEKLDYKKVMTVQTDDDKGLQFAFDVQFTCQEVVNAGAEQCAEKDDTGRTVRSYCPVACKVEATLKPPRARKTSNHIGYSRAVVDGVYNKAVFEASFSQCAAVGSGRTCTQPRGRRQGCACSKAAQCAAVGGAAACNDGFCSYERM